MSTHTGNNRSRRDADNPDYSASRIRSQDYLKAQGYRDFPSPLDYPGHRSSRSNPYSEGCRPNADYPGFLAEPDYLRALSNPDYPGSRNKPYSENSRASLDYHTSFPEPDYTNLQSNGYHTGSAQRSPGFAGYLGSLGDPDSPGAQGDSDQPGSRVHSNPPSSRSNVDHAASRVSAFTASLGVPDYPGTPNQPNSPHFFGKPDYPGAEDSWNSPNFWGEPDYPGAEGGHGYGSSQTPEMTRQDNGSLSMLGREDERYSESFELIPIETAHPRGHCHAGVPGNGYVNPAYMGENSPVHAYGNPVLLECDWLKKPQGQKLISSLVPMTCRDKIKAIRSQPRTMEEKRKLRKIVDKEKSKQAHRNFEMNFCTQCLSSLSLAYCRSKNSLSELLNCVGLWRETLKIIGSKFGTSVLSYFNFLKWLLKFNLFAFIVNFSFIVIPQFTVAERKTPQFTWLEFFTGAGDFKDTVMYYGFYTNSTIWHGTSGASYNMQLAYLFTIGACFIICFFSLLFSMATYFRDNFIHPHIYSRGITKLVFCWDFTVTNEKAVKLKQKYFSREIRENLSEIRQENVRLTVLQWLCRLSAHVAAWLVSTGVAAGCCAAVFFLAAFNSEFLKTHPNPGAVLIQPFIVSCINLVVPHIYSVFRLVERYEMPRHEVYVLLIRNILLKISIIGILCYYWVNVAAYDDECWETSIGQDIYRLLLMHFFFSLADSLLGEFLRRFIGRKFKTSLGLQEFDIARNVLELIYSQTLAWLGIFFCPLLPFIQMITLFIMYYIKIISLMMHFQPPSKVWRASQMITFFIFLLFFPSFTGVLCTLAITIWRLKPSADCGPFRGLPSFIQSVYSWIETLNTRPGYLWVVWIYQNLIESVHFFFVLTLIVLIITYLYWQITEGRKIMIRLLHEQIINEGKDKIFLIEKLNELQDMEKRADPRAFILERGEVEPKRHSRLGEHNAAPDLRFRRLVQEENPNI